MYSQRRLVPVLRPCLRLLPRSTPGSSRVMRRGIASSTPRYADVTPEVTEGVEEDREIEGIEELTGDLSLEDSRNIPTSYRTFMEQIGHKYKFAQPKHYLGETPFPMNPSFKPPPPISDRQRQAIYDLYIQDPMRNSIRRLAKRFNLSLKRLDAILRLKGLESAWKKGKELQTGFQVGMDKLLGAETHSSVGKLEKTMQETERIIEEALKTGQTSRTIEAINSAPKSKYAQTTELLKAIQDPSYKQPEIAAERSDVHQADMLEEEERRDAARYRYERLYWESIPEAGKEPVMPGILQHVKQRAEMRKKAQETKINERYMTHVPATEFVKRPKSDVFVRWRNDRPATKFIDVGAQFIDADDRRKRIIVSQRKSRIRATRSGEKKLLISSS